MLRPTLSRRGLIAGGGAVLGAAALAEPAAAQTAAERFPEYTWSGGTSLNGWPIRPSTEKAELEGSAAVSMRTAAGLAETVLAYVARRYLYEIDWHLQPGEVVGYRSSRKVRADFESNHLSGSAITIMERQYPLGSSGGFFPFQVKRVEAILGDLEGTVAWGGHLDPAKQSHFEIAVGPDDPALAQIAERIATDRTFINPA